MKTHKQGVTLIEILIVIFVILLLVAIMWAIAKQESIRITRIDGCEYLESGAYRNFTRTHKGNCDNPIHYQTPKLEK